MSAFAIFVVILGLLIVVSRGPLIVAPQTTRDFYLRLLDDGNHRLLLAGMIGAVGAFGAWAAVSITGTIAAVIQGVSLLMVAVAAGMIALPRPVCKLASKVWMSFSETAMRIIGTLSAVLGLALIYYGLSL